VRAEALKAGCGPVLRAVASLSREVI
jgi:hypothetical protein